MKHPPIFQNGVWYVPLAPAGDEKPAPKRKPKQRPQKPKAKPKPSLLAFVVQLVNWCIFMGTRVVLVALFIIAMYLVLEGMKP